MHIGEELHRIKNNLRKPLPKPDENFVSVYEPYKEKKAVPKSKDELKRFDMMMTKKKHLPAFKASNTRTMCFNGEKSVWVTNDAERLNELLRMFLKFKSSLSMAIIYDNILPSPAREDRWILKFNDGVVYFNRLYEYDAIVKEKYLKEIERIPVS